MNKRRRAHGEGSIYQRASDGLWVCAIDLGYRNTKRVRRTVTAKTQRGVVAKVEQLRKELGDGDAVRLSQRTVGAYLNEWVMTALPGTVRPSTERSYGDIVRRHLIPGLGHIHLQKLTPTQLRTFLRDKAEAPGYRGAKPSSRTVQYIHAVLRRALEQARKDELIARNVATLVDPPRVSRSEVRPLTAEESAHLLDAVRDDRLCAMYFLAIGVGLRRGEVLGLRWSDIDFTEETLRVSASLQRLEGTLQLAEPKTARSRRTIPLPDTCVEALLDHRQRQEREALDATVWLNDLGLVFTTPIGTPLDPQNVLHNFQTLCVKTGLPRMRFHDLRHTCASLMLAQGIDARVIMDTLGHSTIGTTLNLYTHVMPATQRGAAQKMDGVLRRSFGYTNGYSNSSHASESSQNSDTNTR